MSLFEIKRLRTNYIHATFTYFNNDPANVRNQDNLGGGALLDIGCYCVDVAKMVFNGSHKSIQSYVEYDPIFSIDRLTTGMLEFEEGIATLVCSTQTFPINKYAFMEPSRISGYPF